MVGWQLVFFMEPGLQAEKRVLAEPWRRWSVGPRRDPRPGEHALRVHRAGFFLGVVPAGLLAALTLYRQRQCRRQQPWPVGLWQAARVGRSLRNSGLVSCP